LPTFTESHWSAHTPSARLRQASGQELERLIDAKRCTVQLSTGRLYLDALATPATALLGHDRPAEIAVDADSALRILSSLVPGYRSLAATSDTEAASLLARRFARSIADTVGEVNAIFGEPSRDRSLLIVRENQTLGRCGSWIASAGWTCRPELVVLADALAQGMPFGAVLARDDVAERFSQPSCRNDCTPAALARVVAVVAAVEADGLLEHGRSVAAYLLERLKAVQRLCPQLAAIDGVGLSVRVTFAGRETAVQIRRQMCERGVLVGVDEERRLTIDPPLALRIAEVDVITGALRGAILGSPLSSASVCCSACEGDRED
jgi:acetylornithine/succinyldiaminopimelate/putrescine aminotransferase